jgi:hypothetical protein
MKTRCLFVPIALLALLVLGGCRTQCMADEDATPEQMAKEKRAASRAQIVCKELQRPTIDVKGQRVELSATRKVDVAARADIPADAPRWEPLFVRLERYKRHYKQVWPADDFDPFAYVEVDPKLEGGKAKTLVATVAGAGYTSFRLTAGDAKVDIAWGACGAKMPDAPAATAKDLVAAFVAVCKKP